jgi:hypothetical protein
MTAQIVIEHQVPDAAAAAGMKDARTGKDSVQDARGRTQTQS